MAAKKKGGSPGVHYTVPGSQKIVFSFEFYNSNSSDFCLSEFSCDQIKLTLQRLKDVNGKTYHELSQGGGVMHFHQVYWPKTTCPKGFEVVALESLEPFQFALLGVNGQKARVYGALGSGVFYIVWFDLEHKITPSFKKHT